MVAGVPELPCASNRCSTLMHARSAQISTWAPLPPGGFNQWSVGRCEVTVAVDSGAISRGGVVGPHAATSTNDDAAASRTRKPGRRAGAGTLIDSNALTVISPNAFALSLGTGAVLVPAVHSRTVRHSERESNIRGLHDAGPRGVWQNRRRRL